MYFEQLLFLIPLTQQHTTSSNYAPLRGNNGEEVLMKERRMHMVQVVAHPKLLRVKSNSTKVIILER